MSNSIVTYTDLELDNVFATSGVNYKQEGHRLMVTDPDTGKKVEGQVRVWNFHLLDRDNNVVHTIKDQPTIEQGKQECARWCVANRGGRPRDMSKEEVRDNDHLALKERLAKAESKLEALTKASRPRKKKGESTPAPESEDAGDTPAPSASQAEEDQEEAAPKPKRGGRRKKTTAVESE